MDRQGISPSVYNNNDEFGAMKNYLDAKMDAQMEELKTLIQEIFLIFEKTLKSTCLQATISGNITSASTPSPTRT